MHKKSEKYVVWQDLISNVNITVQCDDAADYQSLKNYLAKQLCAYNNVMNFDALQQPRLGLVSLLNKSSQLAQFSLIHKEHKKYNILTTDNNHEESQ